jgi:hypothetical protein
MNTLFAGVAFAVIGFLLLIYGHTEKAVIALLVGGGFILQALRNAALVKKSVQEKQSLFDHKAEVAERMARGERPNEIAEALEHEHGIAPTYTLAFLAHAMLAQIATERDPNEVQARLAWLSSDRDDHPPPPRDLIKRFEARRNLLAFTGGVKAGGASQAEGALLASRSYLYFFAAEDESVSEEILNSPFVQAIPGAHYAHAGLTVATDLSESFTALDAADSLKKLEKLFDSPDSFAMPWRDVLSVAKQPPRNRFYNAALIVRHGDPATPTEHRFYFSTGPTEVMVDYWIEAVRQACALDGRLLPP